MACSRHGLQFSLNSLIFDKYIRYYLIIEVDIGDTVFEYNKFCKYYLLSSRVKEAFARKNVVHRVIIDCYGRF